MLPEPFWNGRNVVQHNVGSTLIVIDRKEPHGWYRRWHLVQQYNQDQFNLIPVMDQDFITATPGVNSIYTSKASFNANHNWVEVIGGGAAGAKGATATSSGGGGGGGAYNIIRNAPWFAVPGTSTTTVRVGQAGTALGTFPQTGGDSWIGSTSFPAAGATTVGARGGTSPATNTTSTNGTGGAAASGFPTTSPPAFSGGNGTTTPANGTTGSGGGGAGGPRGVGGGATAGAGGSADGGLPAGGAAGSPGGVGVQGTEWVSFGCSSGGGGGNASPSTGGSGTSYGGGGAGGAGLGTGGSGGQGLVIVSWVVKELQAPTASPPLFKSMIAR